MNFKRISWIGKFICVLLLCVQMVYSEEMIEKGNGYEIYKFTTEEVDKATDIIRAFEDTCTLIALDESVAFKFYIKDLKSVIEVCEKYELSRYKK